MSAKLYSLLGVCVLTVLWQNCAKLETLNETTPLNHATLSNLSSQGSHAQGSENLSPRSISLPSLKEVKYQHCIGSDNRNSIISWCSSYELMAYLASYRATRDLAYLRDFITHALDILNKQDDIIGYGKRLPLWSQENYTKGIPYPTLVSTGMITYPLADFVKLVLVEDLFLQEITIDASGKSLKQIAEIILNKVEVSVQAHEPEWNDYGSYRASAETSSYFTDSSGKSISAHHELPFNMYLALGRTIVILGEITKKNIYLEKSKKMVNRFRSWISVNNRGYPYWLYWTLYPDSIEDVSHGSIDTDFLRLAFEAGIEGISRSDLAFLGRSFSEQMYIGAGKVSNLVSGGTDTDSDYRNTMSWMFLAPYFENVKYIGIDASRTGPTYTEGYGAWTTALVREYGGRKAQGSECRFDSECTTSICLPNNLSYGNGDLAKGTSYCKNLQPSGAICKKNRECSTGKCSIKESNWMYLDMKNSNNFPLKSPGGTCL